MSAPPSLALSSFFWASPSLPAASASAGASPSAPSTGTSSAGFSGSLITVGAATVATTKSLSVIVGITLSGKFTDEIFMLVPISVPVKSTIISSGIFSAGHFSSTFLLTMFNTPPRFNPGESEWFINFTGISRIIFSQKQFSWSLCELVPQKLHYKKLLLELLFLFFHQVLIQNFR